MVFISIFNNVLIDQCWEEYCIVCEEAALSEEMATAEKETQQKPTLLNTIAYTEASSADSSEPWNDLAMT